MQRFRTAAIWIILVLVVLIIAIASNTGEDVEFYAGFDEFVAHVETGEVWEVRVDGSELVVYTTAGDYRVVGALDDELISRSPRRACASIGSPTAIRSSPS